MCIIIFIYMFISILGMINPQLTHQIREPGRSGWRRRGCEGRAGMAPEASKKWWFSYGKWWFNYGKWWFNYETMWFKL